MQRLYELLLPALWILFFVYWGVKSKSVKATKRQEPAFSRIVRLILLLATILLFALPYVPVAVLNQRFVPEGEWVFWTGAAVTAAGLLFSVWARRHLGTNWSQAVTVKTDHELITSGPYALVRHPIYTGILLAMLGSAVTLGEWRGLLAVALAFVALWLKAKLEEKWMREHFGSSYENYSRRVAALVPHIL
jgi:protein-S-isoprenylcysteine O-methyltransferase Ste14